MHKMSKYLTFCLLAVSFLLAASGCAAGSAAGSESNASDSLNEAGMNGTGTAGTSSNTANETTSGAASNTAVGTGTSVDPSLPTAFVKGKKFYVVNQDGSYDSIFLDGVNIGASKAGYFPGEFGIIKEDYARWFQEISDMNVQVIRVYVLQMPAFYEALSEFNSRAAKPLYLMQGIYVNEDLISQYNDAFGGDGAITNQFYNDIETAVHVIHGDAVVEKKAGNAGGTYTADISRWVIGWILGIEWSADFVQNTNKLHPEKTAFTGKYVATEEASPFEVFLAETAEKAAACDMENYGTQRPAAFCNWCTTDPLSHPNEPDPETEDAVALDAEHLKATAAYPAGFFASYHVYPYYPDFMSYDTKYLTGTSPDPYLAYLKELNAYHTMPVMVTEYGIPSSRGIAHKNEVTGISQGYASEKQQGEWLIQLNQDIRSAGGAGGLIFSWQDEWFKRTWNNMDYEVTARRPYWHNTESPEQNFGLLASDSGAQKCTVIVDC